MEVSPFQQEIPVSQLAATVEDAYPVDVSGDSFRMVNAKVLEDLFRVRVQVPSTLKSRSSGWESVHSLLIQIFKDRRGKVVRACKSAFQHVTDLAKLMDGVEEGNARVTKKKKAGGFACPPPSKKSERHSNLGCVRPVSSSKEVISADDRRELSESRSTIRIVQRGFPVTILEESTGEEQSEVWVISLLKLSLSEFQTRFPFYDNSDVTVSDVQWDFPDHPLFLPFIAAVCNDLNIRKKVPAQSIGPVTSNGGNNAKSRSVANVIFNSHGSVVEVSGPCAKFEAFVASQVLFLAAI